MFLTTTFVCEGRACKSVLFPALLFAENYLLVQREQGRAYRLFAGKEKAPWVGVSASPLTLGFEKSFWIFPSLCVQLAGFRIWPLVCSVCQLVAGILVSERGYVRMRARRARKECPDTKTNMSQLWAVTLVSRSLTARLQTCPEPIRFRE